MIKFIAKQKNEAYLIIIILLLNLNKFTSIISIICLLIYGIKSTEKSIQALVFSAMLGLLNPEIFSVNSTTASLRTILNLILMIRIVVNENALKELKKNKIIFILLIYFIYASISAIFVSWLPLVSIFKVFYFTIGFMSIIIGIKINKINWTKWIRDYFVLVVLINFITIFVPEGFSRNKTALNGIFNNPNPLGIIICLALAVFIYCSLKDSNKKYIILILLSVIEILLSNSRTSIITMSLIFIYYIFNIFLNSFNTSKKNANKKFAGIFFLLAFVILIFSINYGSISNFFENKLLKGQTQEEILYSREGQLDTFKQDFDKNKLLGVGFGVDNGNGNSKKFKIMLSYPVERGNIILALLAETGLIGMLIFLLFLLEIIIEIKIISLSRIEFINKSILIMAVIMISFGEMTFFSGNNIGIIQWFLIGITLI